LGLLRVTGLERYGHLQGTDLFLLELGVAVVLFGLVADFLYAGFATAHELLVQSLLKDRLTFITWCTGL
jgi:hypothetical protein